MNLDIFLSKYCSEKTKARLSILHNKNYTTYQFLSDKEVDVHIYTHRDDSVEIEMTLSPNLIHITKITCCKTNISFYLEEVIKSMIKKYVEYVAYTPDIKVDARIVEIRVHEGNRIYIPETRQYLDLRCIMK
jgi:hypothetical protein